MTFDGGSQKTYQRMIEEMDGRLAVSFKPWTRMFDREHYHHFHQRQWRGALADTWPFTARRRNCWRCLRIPTLVSWPARVPQGRTSEQVAISMDWMRTLLAAAGAEPDPSYHPMA